MSDLTERDCACDACCEGNDPVTPEAIDNAPGQSALQYRVGTHATFLESMLSRLTTPPEAPATCEQAAGGGALERRTEWPLRGLRTRDADDPTVALLDAWAMVGDVLTFYQERVANEGYLRTATELRSVTELARLTGYRPRPGVAASVDLAFTLEPKQEVEIPRGTRVQSLPQPGKLPQSYETTGPISARADWNAMRPRQAKYFIQKHFLGTLEVYLDGVGNNLKVNDVVILFDADHESPDPDEDLYRVKRAEVLPDLRQTRVLLQEYVTPTEDGTKGGRIKLGRLLQKFAPAQKAAAGRGSLVPTRAQARKKSPNLFSDRELLELVGGDRAARENLRVALEARNASATTPYQFHVFRTSSPLFGYNAARGEVRFDGVGNPWTLPWPAPLEVETNNRLFLDVPNERVQAGGFVVITPWKPVVETAPGEGPEPPDVAIDSDSPAGVDGTVIRKITRANVHPRTAYGVSKTTLDIAFQPPLEEKWSAPTASPAAVAGKVDASRADSVPEPVRRVMTHIESEELRLVRRPLKALTGHVIDLEGLHFDLEPGRTLILEGEDAEVEGAQRAERVVVGDVVHNLEEVSTLVTLTARLRYSYVRKKTVLYGNVARATQGESRTEVLGSGDASQASQTFTLKQKPLTHVPAATVDGAASTLTVRVNGVAWPEAEVLPLLGPRDRCVVTRADEQGRTVVVGGDGLHGTRLPTGVENVTAEYRSGQGVDGNVPAGKITLLVTRPAGVQQATNPLPASGGADPDGAEAIRARVPLGVMSLDRLVSVKDHGDFALNFAGIAKATAQLARDRRVRDSQWVRVVVAGEDPVALDPESDLVKRLVEAFHRYGDPSLDVEVTPARLTALAVTAKVAVAAGYAWGEVEPRVRAALAVEFGYARQRIGQSIRSSRVVAVMQAVAGVDFVDLDPLQGDPDADAEAPLFVARDTVVEADAVLFVDAAQPEKLNLTEWTS